MAATGAQGVHTRRRVGADGGSAGSASRAETRSGQTQREGGQCDTVLGSEGLRGSALEDEAASCGPCRGIHGFHLIEKE